MKKRSKARQLTVEQIKERLENTVNQSCSDYYFGNNLMPIFKPVVISCLVLYFLSKEIEIPKMLPVFIVIFLGLAEEVGRLHKKVDALIKLRKIEKIEREGTAQVDDIA